MSDIINLAATRVDINDAVVGDTLSFPVGKVIYKDADGVSQPYDLTGTTVKIVIKTENGTVVYESTSFSVAADGSYSHVAADETTDTIPVGRHTYYVKFFFANGTEKTALFGNINFVSY